MFRHVLQVNAFGVTSMVKHHAQRAKHELTRLFVCKDTKRLLSNHLKLLPDYFSLELIDQFCNSPLYDQFVKNPQAIQSEQNNVMELQKYFNTSRLNRAINSQQSLQYLELYLHWLLNHYEFLNIHENNYILELLNIDRPDKWFQVKDFCEKRTFIYHHGPTNSGKSTTAVQDLRNLKGNERGIYMAPLRLLAWEYQQKLQNCSLITGQEKQFKNSNLISCTIEAAPLNDEYEVAVIDEIQMIGDQERGWAWTKAVLGVKAKRVHLCGDERALNIISKLLQLTGDVLEERKYSRLSKLKLIHKRFKLENISPGDCIINFSMNTLIRHRNDINKFINQQKNKQSSTANQPYEEQLDSTPQNKQSDIIQEKANHAAIIYGRLPPECRKSQALKFNSRDLPYLVATNAIGMGLNLNIKKIVFMAIERPTSSGQETLEEHQIQQIAGRAGRGKQTGYVQCANGFVLKKVQKALSKVNETYGIQLENIKDQLNQLQHTPDEEKEEEKGSQPYNNFLKRYLKEKQCKIKAACFYFQTVFIIRFKVELQTILGKPIKNSQVLNYLSNYCKLGDLYFMQGSRGLNYILTLLEDKNFDQEELFLFTNGLSLSTPSVSINKQIRLKMEKCHKDYIESFAKLRKVDLPEFIVQMYSDKFENFRYMDQIAEFQFYFNLLETYVWLWGKFEFAFHQIKLAKEIKIELSEKINSVLLKNLYKNENKSASNSFNIAQRLNSHSSNKKHHQRQAQKSANESLTSLKEVPMKKEKLPAPQKVSVEVVKQSSNAFFKKAALKKIAEKAEPLTKVPMKKENMPTSLSVITEVTQKSSKAFFKKNPFKMIEEKAEQTQNVEIPQIIKQIGKQKVSKINFRRKIKKMNKTRLRFKIKRIKSSFKYRPRSRITKKLIKKIIKKFPKAVKAILKFSHRKKKEEKLQIVV